MNNAKIPNMALYIVPKITGSGTYNLNTNMFNEPLEPIPTSPKTIFG